MKKINLHISLLATMAAVAVTALNVYTTTQGERIPQEFQIDLSSSSKEPSREIAGVDTKPDLGQLYESAREYSANGKFDECLAALHTIHQEVTEFEGSRQLKTFCSEGKIRKAQAATKRFKARRRS